MGQTAVLKRSAAFLLAFLLLAPSCSNKAAEEKPVPAADAVSDAAQDAEAPVPVPEETEPAYPAPDVAGLDFGGGTISFIAPQWSTIGYQYTEELNGDALNDAVYNRNLTVENTLNVKSLWTWNTDAGTHGEVRRSVTAGDDAYQIVYTHCIYGISDYATAGVLYDLYDLPHTDFAAPWWSGSMMEDFRIGNRLLYGAGDLILQSAKCMLFNKTIAADYNLPDHYEMVRNGDWVYDKFIELACSVTLDVNGDNQIDGQDQTGYAGDLTEALCDVPFFCGERMTRKTEEGLELVFWSDKMVELFNKTHDYFLDRSVSNGYFRHFAPGQDFSEGLALYTISGVSGVAGLRDYDIDFGIIPGPKYDTQQENYCSYAWPCFVCVPVTITDPEKTGAVLELFCYESAEVQTAYNENLIRGKSTRDVESLEMLDIINDAMVCDIGGSYLGFDSAFHKIFYCFYEVLTENKDNIASHYESSKKVVDKTLSRLYEQVLKAEGKN